jgi:hypothetical protein
LILSHRVLDELVPSRQVGERQVDFAVGSCQTAPQWIHRLLQDLFDALGQLVAVLLGKRN